MSAEEVVEQTEDTEVAASEEVVEKEVSLLIQHFCTDREERFKINGKVTQSATKKSEYSKR